MIKFSVIIPFCQPIEYLYECINSISVQSYKDYEIILLPDGKEKFTFPDIKIKVIPTGKIGPAEKRDIGAKKATGEVLAFIDDDAYPDRNWLKNSLIHFKREEISAVCGPGVTPVTDDIFQQAGGWVNSLWFGSGGAGTYRFIPQRKRFVDDFPSMNFLVRKNDFRKIGGFDTHFWPGEDTRLCYDIVYLLKKKIIYDPKVLAYHHRKPLFLPHLRQISRFALHRGHFARILPATSLRFGYLIPTIFFLFLTFGSLLSLANPGFRLLYITILSLYAFLLTGNILYVMLKSRSILISILTGIGIVLTHIIYGMLFPVGFIKKSLRQ